MTKRQKSSPYRPASQKQHQLVEDELRRLNRTLKALSDSDQAMMRAQDENQYLQDVCRIIAHDCGYAMVWISFAENDPAKSIRPVASAGFEEGYLQTLQLTWADAERGRGPTGTAIRTARTCLCQNMLTDPAFAPWREEALKRGYASSLVLPLLAKGEAFGAITIYARLPDSFSEQEIKLLTELAADLAYGITALRLRAEHSRTERRVELLAQTARDLLTADSPQRVINGLCERVLDFLDCQFFFNFLVNDQQRRLHLNAFAGIPIEEASGIEWLDYDSTICGCAARDACRIVIENVQHTADPRLQLARSYGAQAYAAHPLMVQGRVLGCLSFATSTRTRFTDDDLSLMKVVADQVAIAIDRQQTQTALKHTNEELERRVAERTADLHFTNSLLSLFSQKTAIHDYLDSVVQVIRQWTDCQALGIRLKTKDQEIPYEACSGFEPGFLQVEDCLSLRRDRCLCIRAACGALAEADHPLLTPGGSFRTDDSVGFANALAPEHQPHYRGNCMKFGFASVAVIPVRHHGNVLGVLHLADRRPGHFPLSAVQSIEAMTPLIGEAIHRFQTEAELAEYREHLEVLVRQRTGQLERANAQLKLEVSERKQAQDNLLLTTEDLQRSNHDLEQFAYVASHDLQEPLRAVAGYVRLLEKRFADKLDAKGLEYIAGAAEGAQRMEHLITDLLAYSRVGTRGATFASTDLNAALRNALHNLQASIKTSKAKVTSDSLPVLAADAVQMTQLLQNLVGNAVKFHGEGPPEIHISVLPQEGRWVLSVRDNGIGIAAQYFNRIFQIFQRLHTRKHYAGTGIGLAICKKIVERHGGAIWVESQPGQGSTFFFSLPDRTIPSTQIPSDK
jgi:signal transduction histidine kinase